MKSVQEIVRLFFLSMNKIEKSSEFNMNAKYTYLLNELKKQMIREKKSKYSVNSSSLI